MPTSKTMPSQELHVLSQLTLNPAAAKPAVAYVAGLNNEQRDALVSLADSNHVVMRALQVVAQMAGSNAGLATWANGVLDKERARIQNALTYLHHICDALEQGGDLVFHVPFPIYPTHALQNPVATHSFRQL